MRQIIPYDIPNQTVTVPGSKSYSHRIAIAAGMCNGISNIYNILESEDISYTLSFLNKLGVITVKDKDYITIQGVGGRPAPYSDPIFLGNSGTSMRLLTAVAALGQGTYTLTGTERMHQRPVSDLLDGLRQIGVPAVSLHDNGCPPVRITGGETRGGHLEIDCSISSQYLSALLLIAPCTKKGIDIHVTAGPVSRPYVDMTVDIMTRFGIEIRREGYTVFHVPGNQSYSAGEYRVEPDCSQAGYFWAAAAVTGASITVSGLSKDTRQGDVRFVDVLAEMGCRVTYAADGITVTGGSDLNAIAVDMGDMPDLVPTLAVVAAFAKGTTVVENVAHLAAKESDRLSAVVNELGKMGIAAEKTKTGLRIAGGTAHGAEIDTYNDHRIAMSFAIAGLVVPGIHIRNESCVEKSFPRFWDVFDGMYR